MRLPPPPRRYSPISVMAVTPETVSRPNSRSMAARSSRRSSKTSRPLVRVDVLTVKSLHHGDTEARRKTNHRKISSSKNLGQFQRLISLLGLLRVSVSPCLRGEYLVRPVIRKLHINSKILLAQQRNNLLERVAVFAADPHQITLD